MRKPAKRGRRTFASLDQLFKAVRTQCLAEYQTTLGIEWEEIPDIGGPFVAPEGALQGDMGLAWRNLAMQQIDEPRARRIYGRLRAAYLEAKKLAAKLEAKAAKLSTGGIRYSLESAPTAVWLARWVDHVDSAPINWMHLPDGTRVPADFEYVPWDDSRRITGRGMIAHTVCAAAACAFACLQKRERPKDAKELWAHARVSDLVVYRAYLRGTRADVDAALARERTKANINRFAAVMSLLNGNRPENVGEANTVAEVIEAETKRMTLALKTEFAKAEWYDEYHCEKEAAAVRRQVRRAMN